MTAHKHAAAMMQFAEDAAKSEKPWRDWEARRVATNYVGEWGPLSSSPNWLECYEYRRKPKKRYLLLAGKKIELFTVEPEYETPYFYIYGNEVNETTWDNMSADLANFKTNNCFRTKADATRVQKVVLAIFNNVVEE